MVEIEHACFFSILPEAFPKTFKRLYFGAEFCFWRMPDKEQILAARKLSRELNVNFTLATPVLGENEHQRLQKLLIEVLPCLSPGDEVLISDWGTLELVRSIRSDLILVVGRTLSGQKRGPRITSLPLTTEQTTYFQSSCWHNLEAVSLLEELDIRRVDLDNLLQGLAPLPKGLRGSLHTPYAMVATSRNCPFQTLPLRDSCHAPCGESFRLHSVETEHTLYQDGNTQFIKIESLPADLSRLAIDRIVQHPQLA